MCCDLIFFIVQVYLFLNVYPNARNKACNLEERMLLVESLLKNKLNEKIYVCLHVWIASVLHINL